MDTFFTYLKKSLIASLFVVFTLTVSYVPLSHQNNIPEAEATGIPVFDGGNFAQWLLQIPEMLISNATQLSQLVIEQAEHLWKIKGFIVKETAKLILGEMLQQVTAWVQSGFRGRPLFVQDIEGFLKEVADGVLGEYIEDLGSAGSFLCEPFRLDIRIALENSFRNTQNRREYTCRLSDIVGNIDDFISGTQGSFSQGGWNNWFTITSNPGTYTPYGQYLTAEEGLLERVASRQNSDSEEVRRGNGFLSIKMCGGVKSATGGGEQNCEVVTPGVVIADRLNDNLGSGRDKLVEAREINDLISALLGQVANTLFSGSNSLLDL
tara:strand:+ start:7964 stop:8929 length:966 start_codon:yes stop_codon:yes gene_type:complete